MLPVSLLKLRSPAAFLRVEQGKEMQVVMQHKNPATLMANIGTARSSRFCNSGVRRSLMLGSKSCGTSTVLWC
jgi:hypothetical protein